MNIENGPSGFAIPDSGGSRLREKASPITEKIVIGLHKAFPRLTPDDLTYLGTAGTVVGAYLAWRRQSQQLHHQKPTITAMDASLVEAAALAMDWLDGPMARYLNKIHPGLIDEERGSIVDVVNDRIQELILGLTRAGMAAERGDKLGEAAALLNTLTNAYPSWAKAKKKAEGIEIDESGRGLGILGTRPVRSVLNALALIYPEIHDIPVQIILDTVSTTGNIVNTKQRLSTAADKNKPVSDKIKRQEAKKKKALEIAIGAILGTSLIYLAVSKSKKRIS